MPRVKLKYKTTEVALAERDRCMARNHKGLAKEQRVKFGEWKPSMLIDVYLCAKSGMSREETAKVIGLNEATYRKYRKYLPELNEARVRGRKERETAGGKSNKFVDYVFGQLPPDLKKVWEKVQFWKKEANSSQKILSLLDDQGVRARQRLFCYALAAHDFDMNKALRDLRISTAVFKEWLKDPHFKELLDQMEWHRDNYYESALARLVNAGNPAAVLHVNKTRNAARGYGEKLKIEHSGTVNHQHKLISIENLALPVAIKRQVLDAMREAEERQKKGEQMPALPQFKSKFSQDAVVLDAEVIKVTPKTLGE